MNMAKGDRLKGRKTLQVTNFLDEFEKDDIKREVDIVRLFEHFGVSLTKKGKSYLGKCPWHDDKSPSLSVDREKGLYNCFGCGESGDIFTLTEKMKGLSFRESVTYLKDFAGENSTGNDTAGTLKLAAPSGTDGAEPDEAKTKKTGRGKELPPGEAGPAPGEMTITTVAEYYHKRLFENTKALDYLTGRGLGNPRLLSRFQVGVADGSLLKKIGEAQKKSLHRQGVITNKGREHFKNCIVFPILDDMDMVVGMYGRSLNPSATVNHLYLKGNHRGVFNRKASKVYDEMILTESIIDALSLIQLGVENVQSLYGTNGFIDEHLHILKDDRVKTVVIALDADEAGREGSEKLKERLLTEGFRVKVVEPSFPFSLREKGPGDEGATPKDWNEYLVSGGTKEAVLESIDTAEVFTGDEEERSFMVEKDRLGHVVTMGGIAYRITGVKDLFITNLRVNIKAEDTGTGEKYYDNLDLYSARSRSSYAGNMGRSLDVEPNRIEKDLITILEYLEQERDRNLAAGKREDRATELTPEERELGLSFLKSPDLFQEIVHDMDVLGYVGEDLNKQLLYLAASSRKLDDPISVLLVSESSSGKSMLVEKLSLLIPEEDVLAVTSLSEQALNYAEDLKHKFLDLSEAVHNEGIDHQIREILSGKRLSRFVTVKDGQTGSMVSRLKHTPAVVSLVMSGTNYNLNPENASRCFVVNVDESREQTKRIHKRQQKKHTLSRYYEKTGAIPDIVRKHHAAQKLLERIAVINPLAEYIDFPVNVMRCRRDHDRFLDLIACVCFLRQYQKERKYDGAVEYIECDRADYGVAYDIMINGVLSSTLLDIPGGTMTLYEEIRTMARELAKERDIEPAQVHFIQRDIREYTGLGSEFVKKHLRTLVEYEYIQVTSGRARGTRRSYRLRADEPLERVDFTMIPTPEEIEKRQSE